MDSSTSTFTALNQATREIRLLRLLQGEWEDPICCNIYVVSLDDKPIYEALSYCWGDSKVTKSINLNGKDHSVTLNLYVALRRLRRPHKARTIWIDQLCINQDDYAERTQQVGLMRAIYSNTQEAILWLGDYLMENTVVKEDLTQEVKLGDWDLEEAETESLFELLRVFARGNCAFDIGPVSKWYRVFESLEARPWWSRIWTVQETVLPPTAQVTIGRVSAPWSVFEQVHSNLQAHNNGCCEIVDFWNSNDSCAALLRLVSTIGIVKWARTDFSPQKPITLRRLLCDFRFREATNPADKIYGLLGLTSSTLAANYTMSVADVYKNAVLEEIRGVDSFKILLIQSSYQARSKSLPSWVPDFSADTSDTDIRRDRAWVAHYDAYSSSGNKKLNLSLCNPSTLLLSSIVVDEVSSLGQAVHNGDGKTIDHAIQHWRTLVRDVEMDGQCYRDGRTWKEAFYRTILLDTTWQLSSGQDWHTPQRVTEGDFDQLETFWSLPFSERVTRLEAQSGISLPGMIRDATVGQRLFLTKRGYIGLGPRETEVGDEVSILLGGKMPFVLRRIHQQVHGETSQPSYTHVGCCFVHGIMYGEALEDSQCRRVTVKLA